MQYLHDAEQAGDQEMVEFFREVQECQRHLANRAREMLMRCMPEGNGHERMPQGTGHTPHRATGAASAHGHAMAGEKGNATMPKQEGHQGARHEGTPGAMGRGNGGEHRR